MPLETYIEAGQQECARYARQKKVPAVSTLPRKKKAVAGRVARKASKPASTQGERAGETRQTQPSRPAMNKEHRISCFHKEIAKIPIETVAGIAAKLARQDIAPADSVRQAFEILEIAAAGNLSLQVSSSWSVGIDALEKGKAAFQAMIEAQLPEDISMKDEAGWRVRGDDGKWLPVDFDKAIAALMPRLKKGERMPRFKGWLKAIEGLPMIEAGERMAHFQRAGIPGQVFQSARVTFQTWWESHKRGLKAAAGSMARKGTQGRVKSKDDKRKGARPPIEKMREIFKDR